jgi:polyhydroxybutyrate depolymerase
MLTKLYTSPLKSKSGLMVFLLLSLNFLVSNLGFAIQQNSPIVMDWTINGVSRKALVYIPSSAKIKTAPIIFAFHGHGGTMANMYKTRGFDKLWAEAIFVCPQGLNTIGQLTDPEGKATGWDMNNNAGNKDLLFFDAMYKTLTTEYKVDIKQVFVTGHSNGGGFTYLLWATRGDLFTAVAPTATAALKLTSLLQPKPVFHLTGETDPLVKPQWQKLMHKAILKINKCSTNGEKMDNFTTFYKSESGNPVFLYIHPGGHNYPADANLAIIDFFKKSVVKH